MKVLMKSTLIFFSNLNDRINELTRKTEDIKLETNVAATLMRQNASNESISNLSKPSAMPIRPLSVTKTEKVIATHNFEGNGDDELTFKTGDVIVVVKKIDEGWWVGNLNGNTGLFPSNYVTNFNNDSSHFLNTINNSYEISEKNSSQTTIARDLILEKSDGLQKEEQKSSALGFSYLPNFEPGSSLSSIKRTKAKIPPKGSDITGNHTIPAEPCRECDCRDFVPNVFKPKSCNNCFHSH